MSGVFKTSSARGALGLVNAFVVLGPGHIFYITYRSIGDHPELLAVTRFLGSHLDQVGGRPMERILTVEIKFLLRVLGLPFDFFARGEPVQWSMPEEQSPYVEDYAVFRLAEHTTGASDETSTRAIRAAIA